MPRTSTGLSGEAPPDIQEEGPHHHDSNGKDRVIPNEGFPAVHEEPVQPTEDLNATRREDVEPFPRVDNKEMFYGDNVNAAGRPSARAHDQTIQTRKQASSSIDRASTPDEEDLEVSVHLHSYVID